MRIANALTALAAASAALFGGAAGAVPADGFGAYPAPVWHGRPAAPNFSTLPAARQFRTMINDGARHGVNFAGRYALVSFGCGAGCNLTYMVDEANGRISAFPMGGENYPYLTLDHRADSRLLHARWGRTSGSEACVHQDLVLEARGFRRLAQHITPGACPL
jgi:hypothetical protein